MIEIEIPGFGRLRLAHLVCDYNGTLAHDGRLPDEIRSLFPRVASSLRIHVVTGDTFGTARRELDGLPCSIDCVPPEGQAEAKLAFIERLGPGECIAIGNGRNDRAMLAAAALGIAVVGREGAAGEVLSACDIAVRDAADALELLLEPRRLLATLRA